MKALSIKQPWASLIAHGIKDIENRTWRTHFRGKIYIHASANFGKHQKKILHNLVVNRGVTCFDKDTYPISAIIGEVEIIDCVINHPSIWADKTPFARSGNKIFYPDNPIYNWVLSNPVLYDKPILNVKGKLSFWEFEIEKCHCCEKTIAETEIFKCERCEELMCSDCQAPYNQFSQIDYNCCINCYKD